MKKSTTSARPPQRKSKPKPEPKPEPFRRPRGTCEFPNREDRFGLLIARHQETGRRFLFCFFGDDETATRKLRERCEEMDPFGGHWEIGSAYFFRDTAIWQPRMVQTWAV